MRDGRLVTASRFAAALDAEDYSTARALLAGDCIYDTGAARITGTDALIESYGANGEAARRRFDEVEYASSVEASGPLGVVINFTDRLRLGSQWHEFHCRQHVRVGPGGLIEQIRHEDLPNERQRLKDFEGRLSRPSG
jgi:hypothetical protein